MSLGEKIQALRKQKGMTQDQLADVLNISRQAVSKWETNESQPDLERLVEIGNLFNVSTDFLIKDGHTPATAPHASAAAPGVRRNSGTSSATTCHICGFKWKVPGGNANYCCLCFTSLQVPGDEVRVLETVIDSEGGGIQAEEVHAILTNKRILFTGDEAYDGTVETLGWIFGGLIGGLVGGAIEESRSNKTRQVSIYFEDIASLEVEYSTRMFSRNAKILTIRDKEGNTYFFQPRKHEADQWETAIRNRLAAI